MLESAIVLGAGSWGTALAGMLAHRGLRVQFWGRDEALMHEIATNRLNTRYLPDYRIPDSVIPVHDLAALEPARLVVWVTPSKVLRSVAEESRKHGFITRDTISLSCSKGIELKTGDRMTEILAEVFPDTIHAALSGPNHAEEISKHMATAAVVACQCEETARLLQSVFTLPWFRSYTSQDVAGVEWAGALKNPYAIAAGIAKGMRLGDNAIAALVTRALAEIVRLGVARGGTLETFYGLSGVGDLVATCYSEHSRNHRLGKMLGEGWKLTDALASSRMVVEGVPNTESLWQCAKETGVRTPLLDEIYRVLYEDKPPHLALRELLSRDPRPETD